MQSAGEETTHIEKWLLCTHGALLKKLCQAPSMNLSWKIQAVHFKLTVNSQTHVHMFSIARRNYHTQSTAKQAKYSAAKQAAQPALSLADAV